MKLQHKKSINSNGAGTQIEKNGCEPVEIAVNYKNRSGLQVKVASEGNE